MSGAFRVETPAIFDRWIGGLSSLMIAEADAQAWNAAGEFLFAETQRFAHVVTGFMRGSGELERAVVNGDEIAVTVVYRAPYTGYELARGGSHDFMTAAVESSRVVFEEALLDVATEAVLRVMR